MTTSTTTLAVWLLDRIAEDEADEQARLWDEYSCRLTRNTDAIGPKYTVFCSACEWADEAWFGSNAQELWKAHVLADHSTRVLAQCAAHRRIVEWCSERERVFIGRIGRDPDRESDWAPGQLKHGSDSPVLRMLATVYADHHDYREEWR